MIRGATSRSRIKDRLLLFVGVPFLLCLMLLDACCAAWDEFSTDWRDLKNYVRDEWRGE